MLSELEDWINKKWTEDPNKWNAYAEDKKGIKDIVVQSFLTEHGVYSWLKLTCEASFDITTPMDELNSWLNIREEYSWCGITATLPETLDVELLNTWAFKSTHYLQQEEKDDNRYGHLHEGYVVQEVLEDGSLKLKKAAGVKYIWTDKGADPEWSFEEEIFNFDAEQREANE